MATFNVETVPCFISEQMCFYNQAAPYRLLWAQLKMKALIDLMVVDSHMLEQM